MRQLDQDEKEFIGGCAVLLIITIIPFGMFEDAIRTPLDDWGKNIIASGITKDHPTVVQQAILFVVIDLGQVFLLFPLIFINSKLVKKLGFVQKFPMRWRPYTDTGFKKKKEGKK